ncbi:MAG: EFR1 family ferrodoxin [Candidatus Bathyarchaeota archaeon]|nr:EFR1 family ferrodoxin [Candidatus Bathyarchaeota archaeon]
MNTIYYFTSTGNSLEIARQIATKLGDTQLISMATQPPKNQVGGPNQTIGFVFPVYFFGMPRIVKRFVQSLTIAPRTYCFAIASYGGTKQDTLGMLDDVLKKKGAHLSYAEGVLMPGNYIVRYGSESPEEAAEMRQNAQIKVEEAAHAISNRVAKSVERGNKLLSRAANKIIYTNIEGFDKKFNATDACVSCGLCSQICPVQNIKLEDHRPVWQHHCERCLACIQWCPTEAIQYGTKTANRQRYHNPTVKAQDIIAENMGVLAEAKLLST